MGQDAIKSTKDEILLKKQIQSLLEIDQVLSPSTCEKTLLQQNIKDKQRKTKLRQKINSKRNKNTGVGNSRSSCSNIKLKPEITVTKDIARSQKKLKTIRDIAKML